MSFTSKAPGFVLAMSLALNASGICYLLRNSPSVVQLPVENAIARKPMDEIREVPSMEVSAESRIVPTISTADPTGVLIAKLRKLGYPENVIRSAMRIQLSKTRYDRMKDFFREFELRNKANANGEDPIDKFGDDQAAELGDLQKGIDAEMAKHFGPISPISPIDALFYSYLPPEKVQSVAAIITDYRYLAAKVGVKDYSRLEGEMSADLLAILTPAELADVLKRESYTTRNLSSRLDSIPATETELGNIYSLTDRFYKEIALLDSLPAGDRSKARSRLASDYTENLKAALGAEKYAQWQATLRSDYRVLAEIERRYDVPGADIAAINQLPFEISAQALKIATDRSNPLEGRIVALRELSSSAKDLIAKRLGPELGVAYIEAAEGTWLGLLEKGDAFGFTTSGTIFILTPPQG